MRTLDGRVALITGAARGQGRAHAMTCAREGAAVVLIDIAQQLPTVPYDMSSEGDLEQTARLVKELGAEVLVAAADVRDQSAIDGVVADAVSRFGRLDILLANAGIWGVGNFWELTDDQWEAMIGVNLTGVWRCAKAVAPQMIKQSSGSIVITGSGQTHEPAQGFSHYTAAKHGVIGLMKNIALELGPFGVRCNAVSPGAVRTGMLMNQLAYDMFAGGPGGTEEHFVQAGFRYHRLKGVSVQDPQVIADAALFLNSDGAAHITGVELPVDAGHRLLRGENENPVA